MRNPWGVICCLLALGLAVSSAWAEEEVCEDGAKTKEGWRTGEKPEEWKDQEIREMVTTVMMVRMSRELELTDEQTVLVVRHFGDLRDTLSGLDEERGKLTKALLEKAENKAPDAEIEPLLNQLMAVDEQRTAARRETFEKASANLTVPQKAKLYIFVQEFEWHMRRLIMKAREVGSDRAKRWYDSEISGEGDSQRGPREGDRERNRPKGSPEKDPEKPVSAE